MRLHASAESNFSWNNVKEWNFNIKVHYTVQLGNLATCFCCSFDCFFVVIVYWLIFLLNSSESNTVLQYVFENGASMNKFSFVDINFAVSAQYLEM